MRRLLVLTVVGISLLAVEPAAATIRPQYGMSRVVLGMTKAQVRARLGAPIGMGAAASTTRASGSAFASAA